MNWIIGAGLLIVIAACIRAINVSQIRTIRKMTDLELDHALCDARDWGEHPADLIAEVERRRKEGQGV